MGKSVIIQDGLIVSSRGWGIFTRGGVLIYGMGC